MKKVSILAATALVAVGCNKKPLEMPAAPVYPDMEAPVSFGATADVEVTPSKAQSDVSTSQKLGVFAFKADAHPTTNGSDEADNALWCSAENLEYTWQSDAFAEKNSTKTLFWPGTGTTDNKLSFTSYFPHQSDGVTDYVLTKSLKDQSAAPDYGFAWASSDGIVRPEPVSAKQLDFTYKIAKITFSIIGDGTTVGTSGITDTDVKSIKIYSTGKGLYETYKLDLLTGNPTGETDIQMADPMTLQAVQQTGGDSPKPSQQNYVEAVAYVAPSVESELKSNGITVEIVYNDGVSDQTYTAELKTGTGSLSGDAALANGLVAGKNYKYTLKLGKSGITFTGKVTDWTDVDGGEVDLQ